MSQINFRVTKEEKDLFEDRALKSGLNKTDYFKLQTIENDGIIKKITDLMSATEIELEQSFEYQFKELTEFYEQKFKELTEQSEERYKQYTNSLFKAVVENVDKKMGGSEGAVTKKDLDELLNTLTLRMQRAMKGGN